MSLRGTGSTTIYVCACTLYVHTNRLIIDSCVHACVSISVDAALEI